VAHSKFCRAAVLMTAAVPTTATGSLPTPTATLGSTQPTPLLPICPPLALVTADGAGRLARGEAQPLGPASLRRASRSRDLFCRAAPRAACNGLSSSLLRVHCARAGASQREAAGVGVISRPPVLTGLPSQRECVGSRTGSDREKEEVPALLPAHFRLTPGPPRRLTCQPWGVLFLCQE